MDNLGHHSLITLYSSQIILPISFNHSELLCDTLLLSSFLYMSTFLMVICLVSNRVLHNVLLTHSIVMHNQEHMYLSLDYFATF